MDVAANLETVGLKHMDLVIPLDLDAQGFRGVLSEDYLWVNARDWPSDFKDTEAFWDKVFAGTNATTPSVGNRGIARLIAQGQWTLGSPLIGTTPNVYIHDIQHLASFSMDSRYWDSLGLESKRLLRQLGPNDATFGRPLEARFTWVLEQLVVFRNSEVPTATELQRSWPADVVDLWTSPTLVTVEEVSRSLQKLSDEELKRFANQLHLKLGRWIEPLGGAVADDLSFRFVSSVLDSRVLSPNHDYFADLWGNLYLAQAEGQRSEIQTHTARMLAYLIELKRWRAEDLVRSSLGHPSDPTSAFERLLFRTQVATQNWERYRIQK
jgi:hypothetical protein